PSWREIVGGIVLLSAISLTYPHMVPVVLVPLAVYALATAMTDRTVRALLMPVLIASIVVAATIALSMQRALTVYRSTLVLKDVVAGWFVPWFSPAAVFGLAGKSSLTQYAHWSPGAE